MIYLIYIYMYIYIYVILYLYIQQTHNYVAEVPGSWDAYPEVLKVVVTASRTGEFCHR